MYFIYLLIFEKKKLGSLFPCVFLLNVCERESVLKAVESVHVHIALTVLRVRVNLSTLTWYVCVCERVNLSTLTWCVCARAF